MKADAGQLAGPPDEDPAWKDHEEKAHRGRARAAPYGYEDDHGRQIHEESHEDDRNQAPVLVHGVKDELVGVEGRLGQRGKDEHHERGGGRKEGLAVEKRDDGLAERPEREGRGDHDEE